MLEKFREWGDSWVAKILLGILVISFGFFFGMTDIFHGRHPLAVIATVGEAEISTQEFRRNLEQYVRLLEQSSGQRFSPEQLSQLNVPGQVLTQLIHESLLDQEIHKMNLTMSDEQISQAIQKDPQFQNAQKVFDRGLFEQYLRSRGLHEKSYLTLLRKQLKRAQFTQALLAPLHIPAALVGLLQDAQLQKRYGAYVFIEGAHQKVTQSPDEKTLQAFYEKYIFLFRVPEKRSFTFLRIDLAEGKKDSKKQEAFYALGKKVDDALASGETLEEVAQANGLSLVHLDKITQRGLLETGKPDPHLASDTTFSQYLLEQVFAAEAKADMPVMQTLEGDQLVFRVDEIFPETTPPFKEIQARVREIWMQAQQNILAQKAAEALAQDITLGHTTGAGFIPLEALSLQEKKPAHVPEAVFEALFRLAPGECRTIPAEKGAYVVRLLRFQHPTAAEIKNHTKGDFAKDLLLILKDNLLQGYLQNLKPLYPIKLNEKALQAAF